jgi:hypothetical protein
MPSRSILMSVEDADNFDLFDNIEYKYLRHIIHNENLLISIEVVIETTGERNNEGEGIMRAIFTFDLKLDKEWTIQTNFTWSSPFGNELNDILCDDTDDETEEEEDTDDIYSEPSSPRSVIN